MESFNNDSRLTGTLYKLAQLSGAWEVPPATLYADGQWPGKIKQLMRLAYNLCAFCFSRGRYLFISGQSLRSVRGHVQLMMKPPWGNLMRGGLILRGASVGALAKELGLYPDPVPSAYLADAGVLVISGEGECGLVIVHVIDEKARLERYCAGYDLAREAFPLSGQSLIPEILRRDSRSYGHVLYQQKLGGYTARTRKMTALQLLEHIEAAFSVLKLFEVHEIQDSFPADDRLYRANYQRLMSCHEASPFVKQAMARLESWPLRRETCVAIAHGDYCFPNLLFSDASQLHVSGVLDWEKARRYATIGSDAFYLIMLSFSQWRGHDVPDVLCMILDDVAEPTLESLISKLREDFSLKRIDVKYLVLHFWTSYLALRTDQLPHWGQARFQKWVVAPSESISRWLGREKVSSTIMRFQ